MRSNAQELKGSEVGLKYICTSSDIHTHVHVHIYMCIYI